MLEPLFWRPHERRSALPGRRTGREFGTGELRATVTQNRTCSARPTRDRGAGPRAQQHWTARGGDQLLPRLLACTWHGVLQARHHGNERLQPLAGAGDGRTIPTSISSSTCTSPDAPTVAANTGSPTSAWKEEIKHEGKLTDAYYFCVGGAVGQHSGVARPVGYRCAAPLVPESLERLLRAYLRDREPQENLRAYFARHGNEELRAQLAGAVVEAAERDVPAGRVPHGVAE